MKTFAEMLEWSDEIQQMPEGPEKEAARLAYDETPWTVGIGPRFWGLRMWLLTLVLYGGIAVIGIGLFELLSRGL